MHRLTRSLLALSLAVAAPVVLADAPAAPPNAAIKAPAPIASTPAPDSGATPATTAPATTTTTNSAAEATERHASAGGLTDAEVKRAFAKFRKQQRDGRTVYCRREAPLGTRLGSTVCYSEEQVLANARAERDAGLMQSQQNVCGGGSCSPGS